MSAVAMIEDLARVRHDGVVGATEPSDGIEQDDDVALVLDQPLGLLDHHLGDLHVALGRLVEGRGDDLALDRALHVGHFLGPLVDEQHDEHDLGMILGDGVRELLEQDGLAGLGRRRDQGALPLPDRAQQIDDARLDAAVLALEVELVLGVERRQVVEQDLVLGRFGALEVDRLDAQQGEVAFALLGRPHLARDGVAGVEIEALDLGGRDIDVVRPRQVVVGRRAQEAVALGQDLEHALGEDQTILLGLGLEDLEDEFLLPETAGALDLERLADVQQLGHGLGLELLELEGGSSGCGGSSRLFHWDAPLCSGCPSPEPGRARSMAVGEASGRPPRHRKRRPTLRTRPKGVRMVECCGGRRAPGSHAALAGAVPIPGGSGRDQDPQVDG